MTSKESTSITRLTHSQTQESYKKPNVEAIKYMQRTWWRTGGDPWRLLWVHMSFACVALFILFLSCPTSSSGFYTLSTSIEFLEVWWGIRWCQHIYNKFSWVSYSLCTIWLWICIVYHLLSEKASLMMTGPLHCIYLLLF